MMPFKRTVSSLVVLSVLLLCAVTCSAEDANSGSSLPEIDIYSWEYRLANQHNSMGPYYVPKVSYFYGQGLDTRIYDNAVAMIEDCRAAGNICYIASAYRDWSFCLNSAQALIHLSYNDDPVAYARSNTAPGCNDHQTGLGFDITADPAYSDNYDATRCTIDEGAVYCSAWEWLKEHCAEYGFIVRYPEGKEAYYGVACNQTHLRYVGTEAARYIMDNNLCLEEFLLLYGVKVNLPQ